MFILYLVHIERITQISDSENFSLQGREKKYFTLPFYSEMFHQPLNLVKTVFN